MAAVKKPKTIMDKLCEGAGIPDGETAKVMNLIWILRVGTPEHQKIVREYIEKGGLMNVKQTTYFYKGIEIRVQSRNVRQRLAVPAHKLVKVWTKLYDEWYPYMERKVNCLDHEEAIESIMVLVRKRLDKTFMSRLNRYKKKGGNNE